MRPQSPTAGVGPRQTLQRQLTVWVGVLCLCANFASAFHLMLVKHVLCPERAAWVHVDQHGHDSHGATHAEESAGVVELSAASSDAGHGHEPCLTCSELNKRTFLAGAFAVSAAPVAWVGSEAVLVLRGTDSRYTLSIYAYAPKASPPV
ncbi:MAG: hypothetical protein RJA70_152 [Pseudomonadota bacterium]|jgi:hypothetical protein